jgi:ABC-type multidrug transport system ATPase subunit
MPFRAYFTLAGVPYIAYSSLLQVLPEARESILIVGDVLSLIPQVAFQRGLGAILEISSDYRDEELSWGQVWSYDRRVWFTILIMCVVGTLEWCYLYRLTTARASQTNLPADKVEELTAPIDISDDPATVEERERSQADPEGINARDVVKVFCDPRRPGASAVAKKAVKGISFGIRQNEIFALLGPNGAGKTVTMSILAGEVTPEHGSVALNGVVVEPGDRSVDHLFGHGKVSYVPQFDALFPRQTVHEHLKFYAQVRGLHWNDSKTQEHVNAIVNLLGLEKHREKESKHLSGGYKRRLSLAVALIGYPKALMLDEVTTGLDPSARRLIWDVLKPPNRPPSMNVPSILLSTHYMEEAEALGDRIAIMVDGQFVAAGTLAQLYGKYCTSYFIELSLLPDADTTAILGALPHDATVYESLPHHLKLEVPLRGDPTDQLAHLFNLLENQKTALKIQFYSIAKMNLEQIFIHLSRQQFKADEAFEHAHSQQRPE